MTESTALTTLYILQKNKKKQKSVWKSSKLYMKKICQADA